MVRNTILLILLICAPSLWAKMFIESESVPFKAGDDGYFGYRIPALCVAADNSILAFAEARKKSLGDDGEIDLLVRRSSDGGKTWGKSIKIAGDGKTTFGNPVPILDRKSGKIVLVLTTTPEGFTERKMHLHKDSHTRRIYVCESHDNGLTWTPLRELTGQLGLLKGTWYATGPGGGIQVSGGPRDGRLVVPVDTGAGESLRSGAMYSDDAGQTWELGAWCDFVGGNECQVAQVGDTLLLNMRDQGEKSHKFRRVALSKDYGQTWERSVYDIELPEPTCQGALKSQLGAGEANLFFSNPADSRGRKNLTLRRSKASEYLKWFENNCPQLLKKPLWCDSIVIYEGPSAYSDIALLPDSTVAVFYERGQKKPYDELAFVMFKISE